MAYEEILQKINLTGDQAKIYETLLKGGVMPASKASLKAGLKRGLGYKVIEQLVDLGLVEKIDKKVALFAPSHPSKIKELLQKKDNELKAAEVALSGLMSQMVSDFNLTSGKPNVQFFEGEEGMKKVLEDSLSSKEEILNYTDATAVLKNIPKVNEWYAEQREKIGLKSKILLIDTPEVRKTMSTYHTGITDIRLMKLSVAPFEGIMKIYDGKISYITFSKGQMIGIIIENEAIYQMHKDIFNYTWEGARKMGEETKKPVEEEIKYKPEDMFDIV